MDAVWQMWPNKQQHIEDGGNSSDAHGDAHSKHDDDALYCEGGELPQAKQEEMDEEEAKHGQQQPRGRKMVDPCEGARAGSFGDWLKSRRPTWRFENGGAGLAWDYPTTKAEKREMLLLNIIAEEGERRAEMADLMRRQQTAAQDGLAKRRSSVQRPSSLGPQIKEEESDDMDTFGEDEEELEQQDA